MTIHIACLGKRFVAHALAACVVLGSMVVACPAGRAQTLNAIFRFCTGYNPETDACVGGYYPETGLVQATDGNFYGTTGRGGPEGCGTIFKITPGGKLTMLYGFCYQYPLTDSCNDGVDPQAGLVQASDGNFYGTTSQGGLGGVGTLFRITPEGALTTLYAFCTQGSPATECPDGFSPYGVLVQGSDGDLYGTTMLGGPNNAGTVFRISLSGALTTLHRFDGTDGSEPYAGLVQATDGNFYGTTFGGGAYGDGAIFRITPEGTLTTLYSFCAQSGCPDGAGPVAGLVQGSDGNFYGTTSSGGIIGGTAFRVTPEGSLTTLYSFCSQFDPATGLCMDGIYPSAGLVQGSDGNFYGTTANSITSTEAYWLETEFGGTVFKITPSGSLSTLYSFCLKPHVVCSDGNMPSAALVQGTDGDFYGTTYQGGVNPGCFSGEGCGAVFKLSMGLGAFVEPQPTSGPAGEPVVILGNDLTGATSVSFDGTAARFSVVSSSEIKTNVPEGARTGMIRVSIPSGTLTSNVPFQVTACAAAPCMLPMAP